MLASRCGHAAGREDLRENALRELEIVRLLRSFPHHLVEAGLVDAFRVVHPDAGAMPGRTWSPRFTDQMPGRIDYVYFKGPLTPRDAQVLDQHYAQFPSDHAAVLVRFELD